MKLRLTAFLCALLLLVGAVPAAGALEGEDLRAADTLAALSLIDSADSAAGYNLDGFATRAQSALLLVRLAGAEKAAAGAKRAGFADTPAWAANYINYAAAQGWVSGVTATAFHPNAPVSANAWCTMLLRMLGYSDKAGDFTVAEAAVFARRIGLVSRDYTGVLTRGDMFETMLDALTFSYKDGSTTVIERLMEKGVCTRSTAAALGLLNERLTARQVGDRLMSAVLCMDLYATDEALKDKIPTGNATAFFVTSDGLAITNYHSIADALHAHVTAITGEVYPVEEVVYYDAEIDIAVIRISRTSVDGKTTSAFHALELAGTEDIRNGDIVYAISNPLGLGLTISSGIITSTAHEVERYALPCIVNSADISKGSSGGALINEYGRVIAVTSGAYLYGNNMFLAVPVDPAMNADWTVEGQSLEAVRTIEQAKAEAAEKAAEASK